MTHRFKGLDLIDRVTEELWREVSDIVQDAVVKIIPKKKKCKKAKCLSEKRREVKGKGEKERYTHLNAEFQRIAGRDKKTFLSDQCKEVEEDNGMGKTRDGMTQRDGMGGRWEGGSGWGTHVHQCLIHVNVWQKTTTIL